MNLELRLEEIFKKLSGLYRSEAKDYIVRQLVEAVKNGVKEVTIKIPEKIEVVKFIQKYYESCDSLIKQHLVELLTTEDYADNFDLFFYLLPYSGVGVFKMNRESFEKFLEGYKHKIEIAKKETLAYKNIMELCEVFCFLVLKSIISDFVDDNLLRTIYQELRETVEFDIYKLRYLLTMIGDRLYDKLKVFELADIISKLSKITEYDILLLKILEAEDYYSCNKPVKLDKRFSIDEVVNNTEVFEYLLKYEGYYELFDSDDIEKTFYSTRSINIKKILLKSVNCEKDFLVRVASEYHNKDIINILKYHPSLPTAVKLKFTVDS